MTKIAAIQQQPVVGDVTANLAMCERLGDDAGAAGAEIIVLPEFFTTGMGFRPELTHCALPEDGAATQLLTRMARRHSAMVGGSFLCADPDGDVYNRFLLVGPDGDILGRHDKDLPTMWENCFYVGGHDDGVLPKVESAKFTSEFTPGAAVCWEFMRTQTVHRMRNRVDVVLGGSCWWSIPPWPPRALTVPWEHDNAVTAANIAPAFARMVGAPVAHAAHCGEVSCRLPMTPIPYHGHYQGGAVICDADGNVIDRRDAAEGPGFVIGDVTIGRVSPKDTPREGFWLHDRGPMPALLWAYQNWHGKRWYRRQKAKVSRASKISGASRDTGRVGAGEATDLTQRAG